MGDEYAVELLGVPGEPNPAPVDFEAVDDKYGWTIMSAATADRSRGTVDK